MRIAIGHGTRALEEKNFFLNGLIYKYAALSKLYRPHGPSSYTHKHNKQKYDSSYHKRVLLGAGAKPLTFLSCTGHKILAGVRHPLERPAKMEAQAAMTSIFVGAQARDSS